MIKKIIITIILYIILKVYNIDVAENESVLVDSHNDEDICSICHQEFVEDFIKIDKMINIDDNTVYVKTNDEPIINYFNCNKCKNKFHHECFIKWANKQKGDTVTCPLCMHEYTLVLNVPDNGCSICLSKLDETLMPVSRKIEVYEYALHVIQHLETSKEYFTLTCKHTYHHECFISWIDTNVQDNSLVSCPLCRTKYEVIEYKEKECDGNCIVCFEGFNQNLVQIPNKVHIIDNTLNIIQNYEPIKTYFSLPCGHIFHHECFINYVNSRIHASHFIILCPLCRRNYDLINPNNNIRISFGPVFERNNRIIRARNNLLADNIVSLESDDHDTDNNVEDGYAAPESNEANEYYHSDRSNEVNEYYHSDGSHEVNEYDVTDDNEHDIFLYDTHDDYESEYDSMMHGFIISDAYTDSDDY